jgi:hypothetical protein
MKKRNGFVSNSSSASFIVPKTKLTLLEQQALLAYSISEDNTDGWAIEESDDTICGYTSMDNDALDDYLEKIGFDHRKMEWRSY